MRRSILALTLAAVLSVLASAPVAAAQSTQTVTVTGSLQFSSILGGYSSGLATMSGDYGNGTVGQLRGSVNFALRDEALTITPTDTFVVITDQLNVPWQLLTCEIYYCYWTTGLATFERSHSDGPVDIKLGSLRGSGFMSLGFQPTCTANCPPAGAYYNVPTSGAGLTGGVTSSKDAGTIQLYGGIPVVH